jgi:hypothetical protein
VYREEQAEMVAEEQRRHLRHSVRYPARLAASGGRISGHIDNIGEGGAFFVTDSLEEAVAVGDRLVLEYLPGEGDAERSEEAVVLRIDRYFHEGNLFRSLALRFEKPAGGPADVAPASR